MKTVFFVRHGESESNAAGFLAGSGCDEPLTATGREQAKKAGQDLADKSIELIVSSPMLRTIETAEIIATEIGYDPTKIVQNPLFIERRYGNYEGIDWRVYQKDFDNGSVDDSVETPEDMYSRLNEALEWVGKQKAERILVVSHGGASRAVRVIIAKQHHSHMYKLEALGNAAIYEFTLD